MKRSKEIKVERYTLRQTLPTSLDQELRVEVQAPGNTKPYIVACSSKLYGDSSLSGWGCSCRKWILKRGEIRDCAHIHMVAHAFGLGKRRAA